MSVSWENFNKISEKGRCCWLEQLLPADTPWIMLISFVIVLELCGCYCLHSTGNDEDVHCTGEGLRIANRGERSILQYNTLVNSLMSCQCKFWIEEKVLESSPGHQHLPRLLTRTTISADRGVERHGTLTSNRFCRAKQTVHYVILSLRQPADLKKLPAMLAS